MIKISGLKAAAVSIAILLVGLAPQVASACALCGLSPGDSAGHAFNTSVLFMLLGPYVTFGAIGGIVVFAIRRGRKNPEAADR
jgi:hypothetical protein